MHAPIGKISLYWGSRRKCHFFACKLWYPDYEHNLQREYGPNIYWGVPGLVLKSSIILFDQLSTHFASFCCVEFVTSCLHGVSYFCLVVHFSASCSFANIEFFFAPHHCFCTKSTLYDPFATLFIGLI